ncbi:putative lipoprotein [Streptococcus sp. oral taxon 056 str. F0418]|uniref:LptM family lipoprotein n=1 Tax=Streptococcus sp. oral taxon 056 TaxID=712620 RepID=UPI0002180700|nr:hypothetical protein [Streptococcus sp. oral taxon 056]EGP67404.1 putative lipoprotein [Streptococcus sp. oral taxon 056 str. F0418]
MKKKFLSLVIAIFGLFLLAACGNKNSLDGKYYWINDYTNELMMTVENGAGEWKADSGLTITEVDTEKKQFTYQGNWGDKHTVNYTLSEDGELNFKASYSYTYYKEGSKAYKEALKKYGHDKKD